MTYTPDDMRPERPNRLGKEVEPRSEESMSAHHEPQRKITLKLFVKEKSFGIRIGIIKALKWPWYLEFLTSADASTLFIKGMNKKTRDCFEIPPRIFVDNRSGFKLHNIIYMDKLTSIHRWLTEDTTLEGWYDDQNQFVVFELKRNNVIVSQPKKKKIQDDEE